MAGKAVSAPRSLKITMFRNDRSRRPDPAKLCDDIIAELEPGCFSCGAATKRVGGPRPSCKHASIKAQELHRTGKALCGNVPTSPAVADQAQPFFQDRVKRTLDRPGNPARSKSDSKPDSNRILAGHCEVILPGTQTSRTEAFARHRQPADCMEIEHLLA